MVSAYTNRVNDEESLARLREDIFTNGRKMRWHEYAEKYGIINSQGQISGEAARSAIKAALAHGTCQELKKAKMAGTAIPRTIKEWDTFYGNKRYTVDYKIDQKGDELRKLFEGLKKDIERYSKSSPKKRVSCAKGNAVALEINVPDFHYGKFSGLTVKECEDKYMKSIVELHNKARGLSIERFIFITGNDLLNSEGMKQCTTKGTPQHDNMQWQESFRGAWLLVIRAIDYLSSFAPVDVIMVQGNHDFERAYYIGDVLKAYYSKSKNVTVNNDINSPRKYYEYGCNMLMFTHGKYEKKQDLPLIMASEMPKMWARCKYKEVHCGEVHRDMMYEYQGIKVKFLPSIIGPDAWHKKMGFNSQTTAMAFIWNKKTGCEGYLQVNV